MQLTENEKKVISLLKKRGEMRYTEIQKELGITQGGLTKLLNRLVEKGYIVRELRGNRYPPPVFYKLNPRKKNEIVAMMKEAVDETYTALLEFDPEEAAKLLEELKQKLDYKRITTTSSPTQSAGR